MTDRAVAPSAAVAPTDPTRLLPAPPVTEYGAHLHRHGLLPVVEPDLVEVIEAAGLRGRGGAAFPTGTKLRAVMGRSLRPVVVANGTEGEPASGKDKALLRSAPHLVLDGLEVVARLLGATEVHLCVDRMWPDVLAAVDRARGERPPLPRRVRLRISGAPDRYVAGEESALVHWINGGEAKPTFAPPRVFERGVRARPTFISNVETYANIALIARYGAAWYRALGTIDAPGTTLLTVTGGVARAGVCEAPGGSRLDAVIGAAGGAPAGVRAVLIGGYFGTWIPGAAVGQVTLDPVSLARFGASLGCGVVAVMPDSYCPLQEVVRVTRWMAGENAGQCGPCVHGLPALADALERATAGHPITPQQVIGLVELVRGRGACRHPDGVARFVESSIAVFAEHMAQHQRHGPCASQPALLPVPVTGGWR